MRNEDNENQLTTQLPNFIEEKLISTSKGELGKGADGCVHLVELEGKSAAAKFMAPHVTDESFVREASLLGISQHPNVVSLLGVSQSNLSAYSHVMLFETMDVGSLYGLLKSNHPLPWKLRLKLTLDIVQAVSHLHSLGIIHGDLKSLNILINSSGMAKLSDFGSAHKEGDSKNIVATDFGTRLWQAPELFYGKAEMTRQSDIYSLGVVIGEIVTRHLPEIDGSISHVVAKKVQGKDNINFVEPSELSDISIGRDSKTVVGQNKIVGQYLWAVSQACQHLKPESRPDLLTIFKELNELYQNLYKEDYSESQFVIHYRPILNTSTLESPKTVHNPELVNNPLRPQNNRVEKHPALLIGGLLTQGSDSTVPRQTVQSHPSQSYGLFGVFSNSHGRNSSLDNQLTSQIAVRLGKPSLFPNHFRTQSIQKDSSISKVAIEINEILNNYF